jgi:hypothetical protein
VRRVEHDAWDLWSEWKPGRQPKIEGSSMLGEAPGQGITHVAVGGVVADVVHTSWGCQSGISGSMVVVVPCLGPS